MAEPLRPLGVRPAGQVIIIGLTNHFLVVTVEAALNKPARERARMFTSGGGFKNRVYQQKFPALVCGHCRWKFLAARCDAKTCSPSCRVMLSRARRRAQSRTHGDLKKKAPGVNQGGLDTARSDRFTLGSTIINPNRIVDYN